jgi:hypothetical protein
MPWPRLLSQACSNRPRFSAEVSGVAFRRKGGAVVKSLVTMLAMGTLLSVPAGVSAQSQQVRPQPQQSEDVRGKAQILIMENALKQSVLTGAKSVAAEVRRFTPVVDGIRVETILVGMPTAQGVRVRPHGIVFFVTVPGMNANFIWASYVFSTRQSLRTPGQLSREPGQPQAQVVAQSVDTQPPVATVAPPVAPVDPDVLNDPDAAYRRSVKEALMDTMLDNSGALTIAPEEYLTVAARRDTPPGPLNDVRMVTFSILGADLDAYHQKQLSAADARKRIKVDEY